MKLNPKLKEILEELETGILPETKKRKNYRN